MASIEDLYKKSDFSKLPIKQDKTPLSAGDFEKSGLQVSDAAVEKARGGKLNEKKYSDTVSR